TRGDGLFERVVGVNAGPDFRTGNSYQESRAGNCERPPYRAHDAVGHASDRPQPFVVWRAAELVPASRLSLNEPRERRTLEIQFCENFRGLPKLCASECCS